MAKNGSKGGGRKGVVKGRSQFINPLHKLFTKRDSKSGKIIDVKSDIKPFKGVRKEK